MSSFDSDDERVEELTTLQSIYPELVLDLDRPPVASARLDLQVAPEKPLPVTFAAEEAVHRLSYLPPLLIEVILAEGYPAQRPPTVKLSATPPWIPDDVLRKLEKECEVQWDEYGGMPVLFAYVSYLREAADTVFGVLEPAPDEPLNLPATMKAAMLELNAKLTKDIFDNETFLCGVCLEPKKGSACYRLQRCSHVFCKACLRDFYRNCITEGDVNNVKCMDPSCGKTGNAAIDRAKKDRLLSPKELLQIPLPLDAVKRFWNIKRKKKMEADPTIVFCPRKWCQGAMKSSRYPKVADVSAVDDSEPEDAEIASSQHLLTEEDKKMRGAPNTDRLVVCEDCNLAFCKVCLACWHGDFARCRLREARELTEEGQASLNYILQNTSPCPTCSVPCQKAYGCNHMTCFQCKTHFCYLCGAWLEPGNPYRHFNEPRNKACYQRLMDGAMGDQADGEIQFGGRRGAEQQAEFWEREALRIQIEEMGINGETR